MSEADLQRAAVEWLRLVLGRHYLIGHSANEGKRSRTAGGILKAQGMQPGTPDITITGRRFAAYIELKMPGRKLSPTQEAFRDECGRKGVPWHLCYSLGQIEQFVLLLGIAKRRGSALRAVPPDRLREVDRATDTPGRYQPDLGPVVP